MPKTTTSVQCTRCGHEISLASTSQMYVVKLHKCRRCGKTWFPRSARTPRMCPTCKTAYWNTPKEGKVRCR
jgi:predicted Zn-ribbon and HTH transcriptional regulator